MWRKRNPPALLVVQPLWKTVCSLLKKLKIELLYNPAIPLLDIFAKKTKTRIQKDMCTPMFAAALFTIQIEAIYISRQTDVGNILIPVSIYQHHISTYIYTMEQLLSHKKNEILPLATWVDLEDIMLCEISQILIPYDFIYTWNLKSKINEQTQQNRKQSYILRTEWGRREGRRMSEIRKGN